VPIEPKLAGWASQSGAYFADLRTKCGCSAITYLPVRAGAGGGDGGAAGGCIEVRSNEMASVRRATVLLQFQLEHKAELSELEQKRERLARELQSYEQELAAGQHCEFEVPNEVLGLTFGETGARTARERPALTSASARAPVPVLAPEPAFKPGAVAAQLPFALWFDALRVWPGLRDSVARSTRIAESEASFFVGFGHVEAAGAAGAAVSIRFEGIEPAGSNFARRASAEAMRLALSELSYAACGAGERSGGAIGIGHGGYAEHDHVSGGKSDDLGEFLLSAAVPLPRDLGAPGELKSNEHTIMASGGGPFHARDAVAALLKRRADRPKPAVLPEAALAAPSPLAASPNSPLRARWFVEGVVRLRCAPGPSEKAAAAAWLRDAAAAPGGSLAALAAAQVAPNFLLHLAQKLRLLPHAHAAAAAAVATRVAPDELELRTVLSALLALPSMWHQLRAAFSPGASGADANAALVLLSAAARAADERVLAAGAPLLEGCVAAAAALPQGSASALGALVAALVGRLPAARSAAVVDSVSLRAFCIAAKRASADTPWLSVPLVPTVDDLQGGARWLAPGRLRGLEATYADKGAYLERLFRLLRADALADVSLRVGALARGETVPDRELRRFVDLRVEGYRAHGGALQVALSFRPVTPPRGGNAAAAKLLMDGSLVCIAPRGRWRDVAALQWAVVAPARDALDSGVVVIEVLPGSGVDAIDALRALAIAPAGSSEMVESPEFFTAARFALDRLQALGAGDGKIELPFESELVDAKLHPAEGFNKVGNSLAWTRLTENAQAASGSLNLPALMKLDEEQRATVAGALRTRVWVSQGPPGTGKTTASVAFFSALHIGLPKQARSARPVLMLAVKNHALDQFLGRVQAEHPDVKVVRVGGKASTEALAAANLANMRLAADKKCHMKSAEHPSVLVAWREKCKAHRELGDAQKLLAFALDAVLSGGTLMAHDFLAALSPAQLRDLVLGARSVGVAARIHVDGIDLVTAWADQLATLGGNAGVVGLGSGRQFLDLLNGAKSLVETGVLDPLALETASVTVGKNGKVASALTLPSLKDVALAALREWATGLAGADVRDMFEASPAERDAERERLLLRRREAGGGASAAAVPPANDFETDADVILREARAADVLDDDDEVDSESEDYNEGEAEAGAAGQPQRARRFAAPRTGIAGVIDSLHMSRLGDLGGRGGRPDALAALEFTAHALRPAFAELLAESVGDLAASPLWDLAPRGRALLLHRAAASLAAAAEKEYAAAVPAFRDAAAAEVAARAKFDAAVACNAGVIGMTINGAAKYAALLAALAPQVVIVEEAAEVKEPLLVAALPSSARLLFMAGDHEQLPPKPAYFPFSKPAFALNVSLFERLVKAGVEHGRLRRQNRMHPHLADVVRAVGAYGNEGYLDGAHVGRSGALDRAAAHAARGHGPLWSHAAFWWAHADAEDAGSSSFGHSNLPEARRVARAAAWHMANGIHASRIVVLTGYAAQVGLIRTELARPENLPPDTIAEALASFPEGAELEMLSAASAGAASAAAPVAAPAVATRGSAAAASQAAASVNRSAATVERPRVCTIDEFQGDEADHVILSLVRGGGGSLGFLRDRERIVVAVSRARRSLLIVGHEETFRRWSPDWRQVAEHLSERGAIGPALPLLCPRHSHARAAFAATAAAFVPVSPSARPCQLPCGEALHCGDRCPSASCHSNAAHAATRCRAVKEMPSERTLCGHAIRAECVEFEEAAPGLPRCKGLCMNVMPCLHRCPRVCHYGVDSDHAEAMRDCVVVVSHTFKECGHVVSLQCRDVNAATFGIPPCSHPCTLRLPEPCGHACVKLCGEACAASSNGGFCGTCAEIADVLRVTHALARANEARAAVEVARKNAAAAIATEVVSIELRADDPVYVRVVEQVLRSIQPGHGMAIRPMRILRMKSAAREKAYWEAIEGMEVISTEATQLFHGTALKNLGGILSEGFRIRRERASPGPASHATNMLGAAVYLCPDSSKAAGIEYFGSNKGVLLLCDVLLGGLKVVAAADPELDDAVRRQRERYDSAMMRRTTEARKTSVFFDEYAVYDPRRVLPRYAIYVEVLGLAPAVPLAVPSDHENGATFYNITFDDVKRRGLEWHSPEAHHFFKAQSLFMQLSLNMGVSFAGKKLTKLTYCSNPTLEARFHQAEETLRRRGLPSEVRYCFHGTKEINLRKIQMEGFRMPGKDIRVANGTVHGCGIYLGVTPELSKGYAEGGKMLLVEALNGCDKKAQLDEGDISIDDAALKNNKCQSYEVGNNMFIVASPHMVLPLYVVHWE
jgi:hypothetical protein